MSHRTLISSIVLYKEASSLRYIYLRAGVDITAVTGQSPLLPLFLRNMGLIFECVALTVVSALFCKLITTLELHLISS